MFDFFKTKKKYENVSVEKFQQLMQENPGAVILDVRTAGEFRQDAIKKAKNLDMMSFDFGQKIGQLDKDKTYLVYCRSGNRSARACGLMADAGIEKVYNLSGGIMSWPY